MGVISPGRVDRKLTLDLDDPKARLDPVEDLVAFANTNGGEMSYRSVEMGCDPASASCSDPEQAMVCPGGGVWYLMWNSME